MGEKKIVYVWNNESKIKKENENNNNKKKEEAEKDVKNEIRKRNKILKRAVNWRQSIQ